MRTKAEFIRYCQTHALKSDNAEALRDEALEIARAERMGIDEFGEMLDAVAVGERLWEVTTA